MNLDCPRCGGLLEVDTEDYLLECPYCGAAVPIEGGRPPAPTPPAAPFRPEAAPSSKAPGGDDRVVLMVPWLVVGALVAALGVVAFIFFAARPPEVETRTAVTPAPPAPPPPSYDEPPGPVISRPEAKKVLRPDLLACMKEHQVHYLVTRIGQGYDAPRGLYPPLVIVHGSTVDYRDVEDLSATPLGACIEEAIGRVWFAGNRGAYVHFGLRHPEVPDPLAGEPRRIDQAAAREGLRARDEAALECGRRKLEGFRPGRDLSILVTFRGVEGKVVDVDPYYVNGESPYGRCLEEAYGSVTVPRFRDLRAKVLHKLRFERTP